jgi:hypothetical protein
MYDNTFCQLYKNLHRYTSTYSDDFLFASFGFLAPRSLSLDDEWLELELPDREDELLPELLLLPLLELLSVDEDLDLLLPLDVAVELLWETNLL